MIGGECRDCARFRDKSCGGYPDGTCPDFVSAPEPKTALNMKMTNWEFYFGTPQRTAETLRKLCDGHDYDCGGCWYHDLFGGGRPCEKSPDLLGEEHLED